MSVTVDRKGARHLKPLAHFLKPPERKKSFDEGAQDVASLLDRKIARQEQEGS